MNRRHFLTHMSAYLAATSTLCGGHAHAQWPGQDTGDTPAADGWPSATTTTSQPGGVEPSQFGLVGCSLTGSLNVGAHGMRFLRSSGNPQFDRAAFEEANILAQVTGMQPSLAFLDDSKSPNAFAMSQDIISGRSPHGAVALGVRVIEKTLRETGDITAVGAIMVHEWAHIAQFAAGVRSRGPTVAPTELMADFIAGWFHGFRCAYACQNADPRYAESGLASVGDYNTQSKGHHGTPRQRAQAYRDGYEFVSSGGGGGIYGYQAFAGTSFGNPYGGGGGFGGGGGHRQPKQFHEAFRYAARKYVG